MLTKYFLLATFHVSGKVVFLCPPWSQTTGFSLANEMWSEMIHITFQWKLKEPVSNLLHFPLLQWSQGVCRDEALSVWIPVWQLTEPLMDAHWPSSISKTCTAWPWKWVPPEILFPGNSFALPYSWPWARIKPSLGSDTEIAAVGNSRGAGDLCICNWSMLQPILIDKMPLHWTGMRRIDRLQNWWF